MEALEQQKSALETKMADGDFFKREWLELEMLREGTS